MCKSMQKKKNHLTGGFLKNTLYMRLGRFLFGGEYEARTRDLLHAMQAL